jgi:hypothetical protein
MAKGFIAGIGDRLQGVDALGVLVSLLEKVGEAPLRPQIVRHRNLAADGMGPGDLAVFGLEQGEQTALHGQAGDADGVVGGGPPTQRTGDENVDISGALDAHGPGHLGLEVVEVGDAGGGDVGDVVGHGDQRQVLAGAEDVAGLVPDRGRGGGARRRRRGAGALDAGVHVGLVVVTDVEHVVVALEHARQTPEADVGGAAVAALGDDLDVVAALDAHGRGNAGGDRGGVAEERVDPGDLPRGLGVGRGEHL